MIQVGITELHGIAKEYSTSPPDGVEYSRADPTPSPFDKVITSTAKGVLSTFHSSHDILEAPLFPIRTRLPWIFTPADFASCLNFGLLGAPTPRTVRCAYFKKLLLRDNFQKLLFKSNAGRDSMNAFPLMHDDRIRAKVDIVYPAIRTIADNVCSRRDDNKIRILFSGDFFRKGGAHVVNAFERLQSEHDSLQLRICSNPNLGTDNVRLRREYQQKIARNDAIQLGPVPRQQMTDEILPATDIFASPTYAETFGFGILEAMAHGIPVVATNHFAIPEMLTDKVSGMLIDTGQFPFIRNMRGYTVSNIPTQFMQYMDQQVYCRLKMLVGDSSYRQKLGHAGRTVVRSRFSMKQRNDKMARIYAECLN